MTTMTPRARLEAFFRGGGCDRVPFVIWSNKLPAGEIGQAVLDAGACVIVKSHVLREGQRTIPVATDTWIGADGRQRERTTYRTPAG